MRETYARPPGHVTGVEVVQVYEVVPDVVFVFEKLKPKLTSNCLFTGASFPVPRVYLSPPLTPQVFESVTVELVVLDVPTVIIWLSSVSVVESRNDQ